MIETCVRCKEADEDRRTLWMACFYEMNELGLPFIREEIEKDKVRFYTLRVCKDCRADWLGAIKKWFHEIVPRGTCGSGIFIRENGANVEISETEWYDRIISKLLEKASNDGLTDDEKLELSTAICKKHELITHGENV